MLQRKGPQFAKEITRKSSDLISVNLVICCVNRNKQRIFLYFNRLSHPTCFPWLGKLFQFTFREHF